MRSARLWAGLLGLAKVVVEDVEFDEVEQVLVVSARPRKATKRRCGRCGKRCPGYDQGEGRRRWRTLDFGRFTGRTHPRRSTSRSGTTQSSSLTHPPEVMPPARAPDHQR